MPRLKPSRQVISAQELKALCAGRSDKEIANECRKRLLVGRRRKEIDLNAVAVMRSAGCTITEVAAKLGVSEKTLDNRLKEDPLFRDVFRDGNERGKAEVRLRMHRKAVIEGDTRMLIHVSCNRLGYTNAVSLTGKNGGPIQIEATGDGARPDYSKLSEEEIAQLRYLAAKSLGEAKAPGEIDQPRITIIDGVATGVVEAIGQRNGAASSEGVHP